MKTFYTACYGRARSIPVDYPQVRTSRGIPEWWKPTRRIDALPFAPEPQVFAAAKSDPPGNWKAAYRKQLDALHARGVLEKVVNQLPDNSVLMCFESDPRDCHRSILAAYLVEKGLAIVKEWVAPVVHKPEPPKDPQLFLL